MLILTNKGTQIKMKYCFQCNIEKILMKFNLSAIVNQVENTHLFNKYILSIYYMLGILYPREVITNHTSSCPHKSYILKDKTNNR